MVVDLTHEAFSHGAVYVAVSRVREEQGVRIAGRKVPILDPVTKQPYFAVKNIVYKDFLNRQ